MSVPVSPKPGGTRPPAHLLARLAFGALACAAILLAGCGSSSKNNGTIAQTPIAALANSICHQAKTSTGAAHAAYLAHRKARVAKLYALLVSERKLPAVNAYLSDIAAQKRLRSILHKAEGKEGGYFYTPDEHPRVPEPVSLFNNMYELSIKIRADAIALGMSACVGPQRAPIGG